MNFYYVYRTVAHRGFYGYTQSYTLEERLAHIQEAKRIFQTKIPWLCDSMQNHVLHTFGNHANSAVLLDSQGQIVLQQEWCDAQGLRNKLNSLLEPVENPSSPIPLNLASKLRNQSPKRGQLLPIKRPRGMKPLLTKPANLHAEMPYYLKLRVEAGWDLIDNGKGPLYLGFYLDPLYKLHWNNLLKPISVKLEPYGEMRLRETSLTGPNVSVPSDSDPREFLVDVISKFETGPLMVTVTYMACNETEGWCRELTHQYKVYLKFDPDGGWEFPKGYETEEAIERLYSNPSQDTGKIQSTFSGKP